MNKEQEKEYKRLERHTKDCGVAFGIYSKQYAQAHCGIMDTGWM